VDEPDALLGGKLLLRQAASGHRAGTDAVLLAAAAGEPHGLVLDIGAGAGAAGLAVALRAPGVTLCCVEIDPTAAALARQNIALNGLHARASCVEADVLSRSSRNAAGLREASAALIVTNPPYLEAARARVSPDAARARAHVGSADAREPFLARWMRACAALLAPGGRIVLIHRADALDALTAAMAGRFGGLWLLPVHPRVGAPASRVLAAAVKGSRAPLSILPPLVLHEAQGHFTARAEAIHRGEALIDL
jgi:tRNA1(Val) A37 N6-methylase TrmN6